MSNGPPKKTKVRRLAKVSGAVVVLVIGLALFASIKADKTPPLHWAAAKNKAETAQLLITWGANVNAKTDKGRTPLHWAARNNATETAQLLLTQGAEINAKDNKGSTPLHYAARNNAAETAQLLLTQGANVNTKNSEEATPLHWGSSRKCKQNGQPVADARSRDLRQRHIGPDTATLGGVEQCG